MVVRAPTLTSHAGGTTTITRCGVCPKVDTPPPCTALRLLALPTRSTRPTSPHGRLLAPTFTTTRQLLASAATDSVLALSAHGRPPSPGNPRRRALRDLGKHQEVRLQRRGT